MRSRLLKSLILFPLIAVPVVSAQELENLRIEGPVHISEGSTAYYSVFALFDNGREYDVTLDCDLRLEPGLWASIGPFADVTAAEVEHSQSESIRAKYSSEFGEANAELTIGILDLDSDPGHALSFDGQDDLVRVNKSSSLEPTEALTVECWVKGSGGNQHAVLVRKADHADAGFVLRWRFRGDSRVYFQLGKHNLNDEIWVVNPIPNSEYEGEWHHFAAVYSVAENYARLYVDGELAAEEVGYGLLENTGDLYLGSFSGTEGFLGQIDEVRIWSVARAQEEIRCAMHRSLEGNEEGLVGHWRMNEAGGQTVNDESPFANHGTLGQNAESDSADPLWVTSDADIRLPPGDCTVDCGAIIRLKAKCRGGRLVAKLMTNLDAGDIVSFDNGGDRKDAEVDEGGRARAVWREQSGVHAVHVVGCEQFVETANCRE